MAIVFVEGGEPDVAVFGRPCKVVDARIEIFRYCLDSFGSYIKCIKLVVVHTGNTPFRHIFPNTSEALRGSDDGKLLSIGRKLGAGQKTIVFDETFCLHRLEIHSP